MRKTVITPPISRRQQPGVLEEGLSLVGYVIATKLQSTDNRNPTASFLRHNGLNAGDGEGGRLDQIYIHDPAVATTTPADGLPGRGAHTGSINHQRDPHRLRTEGDEVDDEVLLERIYAQADSQRTVTAVPATESDGWREVAPDMVKLQIS